MSSIGKLWAGRVFGTNTGNLFIELTQTEPELVGKLRIADSNFGVAVFNISGTYTDKLRIKGTPAQCREGIMLGDMTAEAILTPKGQLKGKWETAIGTAGTFEAYPHDFEPTNESDKKSAIPEQVYLKHIEIGSVRLFADDVVRLLDYIKQDFSSGRLIITYDAHGSEITKYSEDFLRIAKSLPILKYLKIYIEELEAYQINRVVVLDLRANGTNDIRVQGVQESWVIGKAEGLANFLRRYESTTFTTIKKHGVTFNQIILLIMIVVIPSIASLTYRAVFAFIILLLVFGMFQFHTKFIPNAYISMDEKSPSWISRYGSPILSWFMTIVATVIGGLVLYWLKK